MDLSEKVGKYLTFADAVRSPAAKRHGIDNIPEEHFVGRIKVTAENIYDKVADKFGRENVSFNSFVRSEKLNAFLGGANKSQHTKCEAIDLDSPGNKINSQIFDFIRTEIVFDQLIAEYPDKAGVPDWVHASYVSHPKQNRGQVLVKLKDRYIPYGEFKIGME